jgi:hypothetical protein
VSDAMSAHELVGDVDRLIATDGMRVGRHVVSDGGSQGSHAPRSCKRDASRPACSGRGRTRKTGQGRDRTPHASIFISISFWSAILCLSIICSSRGFVSIGANFVKTIARIFSPMSKYHME